MFDNVPCIVRLRIIMFDNVQFDHIGSGELNLKTGLAVFNMIRVWLQHLGQW